MTGRRHLVLAILISGSLAAIVGIPNSTIAQTPDGFDETSIETTSYGGKFRAEFEQFDRMFQETYFDKGRKKTEMSKTGFYPYSRIKRFWELRADHTGALHPQKRWDMYFEALSNNLRTTGAVPTAQWETLGPNSINGLGGRMISFAFHPTQPETIYAGSNSGGLWWTTNGGGNWAPLTDQLPSMSVSSVAINPYNTNEMMIGTGWPWGNSFTSQPGVGVLRSTDAGLTWQPTALQFPLSSGVGTYDLIWDYSDSSRVYLSTNVGLYRTDNLGLSWSNRFPSHCTSVVQHPSDPNTLFAAIRGDGIYKSTNRADTWTKLTNGLPPGAEMHQTNIAICRDYPDVMFALVTNPTAFRMRGLYKSSDGGTTWTDLFATPDVLCTFDTSPSCSGWLFGAVSVAPSDSNFVLAAGVRMYISTNSGQSWAWRDYLSNGSGPVNDGLTYVDTFQFGWHPNNDDVVYTFNDGGVFKSVNKGLWWDPVSGDLETAMIYKLGSAQTDPDFLIGGTQDHGFQKLDATGGNRAWTRWTTGDGGPVNVDPTNENIVYAALNNGNHIKSTNGASTFDVIPQSIMAGITESGRFIVPQEIDPQNPQTLWTASLTKLYKTTNGGAFWNSVLNVANVATIAIDQVNPNIVYVHAYDNCCWQLWRTLNGGANWTQLTDASIPTWRVTDLETSPTQEGVVYATRNSAFANSDHVKVSFNYGSTWTDITSNLPDVPTSSIAISPNNSNQLYLGTDLGVWLSVDGGTSWNMWNDGLPAVYVSDIEYYAPTEKVRIATLGRGAWQTPAFDATVDVERPDPALAAFSVSAAPTPFQGSTTIRFRLPEAGAVQVQVFNSSGQRVADLASGPREAGEYSLDWSGATSNGLVAPAGVYFARVTLGQMSKTVRIVRL